MNKEQERQVEEYKSSVTKAIEKEQRKFKIINNIIYTLIILCGAGSLTMLGLFVFDISEPSIGYFVGMFGFYFVMKMLLNKYLMRKEGVIMSHGIFTDLLGRLGEGEEVANFTDYNNPHEDEDDY